jgi:hypothetical protein
MPRRLLPKQIAAVLTLIILGLLLFSAGAVAQQDSLPKQFIEATLQVPEGHPVVGYPFSVSALVRVHQISKQGTLSKEYPPRYLKTSFSALPPITGKLDPYIVPDYAPDDLVDGFTREAEFTCKEIGEQPIEFVAPINYRFKTPEGEDLAYATEIKLTKNVTCAGPSLDKINLKKACESATFTGKMKPEYLSELAGITIKINESERAWKANPTITPSSDGSFSYSLKLHPSTYHYWVYATTKKGITYEVLRENSFDIDKCEKTEPTSESVAAVSAGRNVDGQSCTESSPYVYQCTSGDSFTVYKCERPSCKALAKAAEDVGRACSDKYGIKNDCVLPLANEFMMNPDDLEANNQDDAEVEARYREMEAECEEPTLDGGKRKDYDPCCAAALFSGARACSAAIISAREAVEACRYRKDVAYVYKPSFPVACGGCTPGKILSPEDACYPEPSTAAPAEITLNEPAADVSQLAKFRSDVMSEAEKIISIKECGAPRLPIQNLCVAEKLNTLISGFTGPAENFGPKPGHAAEFIEVDSSYALTQALLRRGMADETVQEIVTKVEPVLTLASQTAPEVFGEFRSEIKSSTNLVVLDVDLPIESAYSSLIKNFLSEKRTWEPMVKGIRFDEQAAIMTGENSKVWIGNNSLVAKIDPGSIVVAGATKSDTLPAEKDLISKYIAIHSGGARFWNVGTEVKSGAPGVYIGVLSEAGAGNEVIVETPLTITKSKHTQFAVSYDPERQYALTAIYEGEVEVTDKFTGETAVLTPTDDGKPRLILVPLAAMPEQLMRGGNLWLLVIILLLLGGGGFWLYKRKTIAPFA